ncbi:MAG: efflux RND transporter permease subunit, partial [Gemmatimonadota bacterium]
PVTLRDQPRTIEDLALLPVRSPSGRVFLLGELAEIRQEEDTRGRFNRFNGQSAVSMSVSRLAGADAIQTSRRVIEVVGQLRSVLPPGVRFTKQSDESIELAKQLRDLAIRGGIAFLAVLLVLTLALRRARTVLLVMGSAAVAIAGTALALYLLKVPANMLTLAGLGMGVGILVQNGLIVVERLRSAPDTPAGRAEAGRDILPAVAGSTLTTAVVLLPFLYLQGNARAAFVPFAVAFAFALLWSVIASVIMIPAVGAGTTSQDRRHPTLRRMYDWTLVRLLRWRWAVIGVTTASLGVLGWGFATKVERLSFGGFGGDRTTLFVSVGFPRGSDPESLDRAIREFESIAVGREGVEQVRSQGFGSYSQMRVL